MPAIDAKEHLRLGSAGGREKITPLMTRSPLSRMPRSASMSGFG